MTVHVYPVDDLFDHDLTDTDCLCGPYLQWCDPDTGDSYPAGPLVVHYSLDGRERHEEAK